MYNLKSQTNALVGAYLLGKVGCVILSKHFYSSGLIIEGSFSN